MSERNSIPLTTYEEAHLNVLRALDANPSVSQRELARDLGISLGKTNYCLQALLEKGLIKAKNFKNKKNKIAYSYPLTPHGIEEKARLTLSFLKRKQTEFEALKVEIEQLSKEAAKAGE